MGRYGYGERNDRGERLLEFAGKMKLFICNTRFQHKASRKWTWLASDGQHANMIDMVLIDRRWKTSVRNCRTYQGADTSSDHSLVLAKVQLRLKRNQKQGTRSKQWNFEALKTQPIRTAYATAIQGNLEQVKEQHLDQRVERLKTGIVEAMKQTVPEKTKPNELWISDNTLTTSKRAETTEAENTGVRRHETAVQAEVQRD